MKFVKKVAKKLLQRQNSQSQISSRFTPASDLKQKTFVLFPNFIRQQGILKKLQLIRKRLFQSIEKPNYVTYKLIDQNEGEVTQHRNKILQCYPKEQAIRELIYLYSFTGLDIVDTPPNNNNPEIPEFSNKIPQSPIKIAKAYEINILIIS